MRERSKMEKREEQRARGAKIEERLGCAPASAQPHFLRTLQGFAQPTPLRIPAPGVRTKRPHRGTWAHPYHLPSSSLTFSHHAEPAAAVARSSTNTSGVRPRALPFSAAAAAAEMEAKSTGRAMSADAW